MRKETVVRQNSCDREMNLLLFLCFFFYMAVQIFAGDVQSVTADRINMALYLVFAPGLIFAEGYRFAGMYRLKPQDFRERYLAAGAGRFLLAYLLLSLGSMIFAGGRSWEDCLPRLLSLLEMPSVSAVFFTLLLLMIVLWGFGNRICAAVLSDQRKAVAAGVFLLASAMLWTEGESYLITAALFGSSTQPAVPLVPYFVFFLAGIRFWEEKPGFQWKTALCAAAVTAVSLLLYRTPLRPLLRVTASFLPVYLVYCLSELCCDLSVRFRAVRFACGSVWGVFIAYGLLLLLLGTKAPFAGASPVRALLYGGLLLALIYAAIALYYVFAKLYERVSVWMECRVRHKTAFYFLLYTLAFAILAFLVFFEFFRTGTTFIVKGDGVSQYFPRVIYFVRYIRELISGFLQGNFELPMYDFRNGLGTEITYSLEPVYFLYLLFDEEHLELAYDLLTIFRFYLSGISVSVLCLYFKKDYFSTFIAAVVYVFCGFTLYGGSMHTMFMIPVIMLPLLILSMEEILRKRRWYLCSVFVALSLFGNYYYLYMNTIAMGIYFVVRFFCQKDRGLVTVKNFFTRGLVICGSYLLGVGMSCIVLATKFGMYLGSGRSGSVVIKMPSLFYYGKDWLVSCFMTFITTANSPGEWLKFGYLPLTLLAVVFLFLRKGRTELKTFSVIALIFSAFPVFGFIFSGFSTVINRWCYMAALTAAYITADTLPQMQNLTRRDRRILSIVIAVYGYLAYFGQVRNTLYTHRAFFCLVLTFVVLLSFQEDFRHLSLSARKSLLLLLTFAMAFYQGFSLFHTDNRINAYMKRGTSLEQVVTTPLAAVSELEDDSFYRAAATKLDYYNSNAPILLDYNSTTMVSSTLNGSILEFLETMGATSYTATSLRGMGNRAFLNNLAAVKYLACYEEDNTRPVQYGAQEVLKSEVDGRAVTVYENRYALPIGYTYSNTMTEEELESYDVSARQEVLMQSAVLNDAATETSGSAASDIRITGRELEIQSVEESRAYLTENALFAGMEDTVSALRGERGEASSAFAYDENDDTYDLTLTFESDANAETYLVLENALLEGDMSENPINLVFTTRDGSFSYSFSPDDYRYKSGQSDYVFHLGYHKEPIYACRISMGREGTITFDSLKLYSQPMDGLEAYTEGLTENVLENVSVETNRVSGTISLAEEKTLVLSIPYQRGWTAYVNGEKTELLRANYMYMALQLEPGEHTIELEFAIPGVKYALVIMPSSALLFAVLCTAGYVRKRRKKKKTKTV